MPLNPTVIEVRCSCGRCFNIRTRQALYQKTCANCQTTYVARLYQNGAVTMHYIERGSFIEHMLDRERFSIVTDGE